MNRTLRTSYADLGKDKVGPFSLNSITRTTGNPYFPDAAPYLATIRTALDNYLPAAAIKNPLPEQTRQMEQYRKVLDAALMALAEYANGLYPKNEAALLSTGLDLVKERERHTTLGLPKKYSLHDGTEADTICAKVVRADYAVATEIRYTDDPTKPWHQWLSVTTTKASVLLRGYKKKTEVFAMFRSVGGDTDDQPFTEVLSRIVQ